MATIREVARAAGVSTATVSNVLNGRKDRVSQVTVERVLSVVRDLKYRPTALELNQKAILTGNIGFIVADVAVTELRKGGYHQEVLHGVLEGAASHGCSVTVFFEKVWDDIGLAIRRRYDGRCDGVVMVAPQPGAEVLEMLHARGTPLVAVGVTPWLPGIPSVDLDNHAAGAMAARLFIEQGHRSLAFVSNGKPQISAIERQDAFVQESLRLGLKEDDVRVLRAARGADEIPSVVDKLLEPDAPTAIMVWHDGMALRLIQALRDRGVKVPGALSVISVDDIPEDEAFGLSSFKNPADEIGRLATNLLIENIQNPQKEAQVVRLAPEFVQRSSSGRPSLAK